MTDLKMTDQMEGCETDGAKVELTSSCRLTLEEVMGGGIGDSEMEELVPE